MAIESRLRELDSKHRELDARIVQESRRPAADWSEVKALKRMKLKMKEELEALQRMRRN